MFIPSTFIRSVGYCQDLHSFPTRRSSDLRMLVLARQDLGSASVDPATRRAVEEQLPDRKSTRLNSSHSQISYAVFCLKKKSLLCSSRQHSNGLSHHVRR